MKGSEFSAVDSVGDEWSGEVEEAEGVEHGGIEEWIGSRGSNSWLLFRVVTTEPVGSVMFPLIVLYDGKGSSSGGMFNSLPWGLESQRS
jgi:hypothetical protein